MRYDNRLSFFTLLKCTIDVSSLYVKFSSMKAKTPLLKSLESEFCDTAIISCETNNIGSLRFLNVCCLA